MPQVAPAYLAPTDDALEYLNRLRAGTKVDHLAFAERNFNAWQATSETLDLISVSAKSLGAGRSAEEKMQRLATLAPHRRHLLRATE